MNTHSLDNEWAQKYSFHISEQIREKAANLVDLAEILFYGLTDDPFYHL